MPCTMVDARNTTVNNIDTAPALRKLLFICAEEAINERKK